MKNTFTLLLLSICLCDAYGQQFKTSLGNNGADQQVIIRLNGGSLEVRGHNSDEIVVEAQGYEPPPEQARGLRPLYAGGPDNSGLGLNIEQDGRQVTLMSTRFQEDIDYLIYVPDQVFLQVTMGPRNEDLELRDFRGEIEIKAHSDDVKLFNVSGPLVANSISGDIEITFGEVNAQTPTVISVVSGDIDLSLPENTAANLHLKSVSGEVYTDFDIDLGKGSKQPGADPGMRRPIKGTINGGGASIELNTVSGNIYLRKL